MAESAVRLLGTFEVRHEGTVVTQFRGDKVRALLAYLAVEADRPHPRSELAGLLWPEQPEEQALRNVSQALVRLRRALHGIEDPLVITRQTVQWRAEAATVDVLSFTRLVERGEPGDLAQAAALYRGELLVGFALPECDAFEDWLLLTRERLGQQALIVLQQLGDAALAGGEPADAVAAARRQLALDPWREPAYRQLMLALAQSGDRAGALAAYARCRTVLADDLSVTPDEETRALAERIEAGIVPVEDDRSQVAGVPARAHNLPAPLVSLVGREDELAILSGRLQTASETRLLTVVGVGGSGKSRLALAGAWDLRPQFPDGVWWVELAGIQPEHDPTLQRATLASTVAAALGVALGGRRSPLDELATALGERTMLVVLDNCEHLPEAGPVARVLLQAAPHLRVLTTSREPLGVWGEALLPLEGLPVPDEGALDAGHSPAVQLFLDRAGRRIPGWGQEPEDVTAAGRLCRLLEGMPLGIELAAQWAGHYTPDEIATAMQHDLTFLTARTHDVPERQRSLRAVFDTTWTLLTDSEQQALAGLSIFRGSFNRSAAQGVAGVAPTTLATLVDKSLLRRLHAGRYGLHELLRQFAAERLAEAGRGSALEERHLVYYLALAEQAAPEIRGPRQREWLERLDRDLDNLRAALGWARELGASELGLRLASALERFWDVRNHVSEARTWLETMLAAGEAAPARPRAAALNAAGRLANRQDDYERAETLHEEALVLWRELGDQQGTADSLSNLGRLASRRGDFRRATELLEEALALRRGLGDQYGLATSLTILASLDNRQGNVERAMALNEEALALRRKLGDWAGIAASLNYVAALAYWQGEFGRAERLLKEALQLARDLGDQELCAMALIYLGHDASRRGDVLAAMAHYQETLRLSRDAGLRYMLPHALEGWAWVTRNGGDGQRAAQLFGAAAALRAASHAVPPPYEATERDQKIETLRAALGAAAFERGWAEGQQMLPDEAVALALADASERSALEDRPLSPASKWTPR